MNNDELCGDKSHTTGHFCTPERCSGNAWLFFMPEQRSSIPVFHPSKKCPVVWRQKYITPHEKTGGIETWF
jgi:hypothetical protein